MSTVTAILATFDSERFIRNRLENLLGQTMSDRLEIVLIDSGSTQGESRIAEDYVRQGANIKLLRTERETLYASWNRAIDLASGDYLISTNADDRLTADACEVMAAALDQHPEVGLVYSDAWETAQEREVIDAVMPTFTAGQRRISRRPYAHSRLLLECCCGPFPMWRRNLHAEVGGFDHNFVIAGDWDCWLRMAEITSMMHIPTPLGLIAWRADSLLRHDETLWLEENARIRRRYFSAPNSTPQLTD